VANNLKEMFFNFYKRLKTMQALLYIFKRFRNF
jgi:hypothetical protein